MTYKIMKSLISNRRKTSEELRGMLDVFYGAGRLTKKEYEELKAMI